MSRVTSRVLIGWRSIWRIIYVLSIPIPCCSKLTLWRREQKSSGTILFLVKLNQFACFPQFILHLALICQLFFSAANVSQAIFIWCGIHQCQSQYLRGNLNFAFYASLYKKCIHIVVAIYFKQFIMKVFHCINFECFSCDRINTSEHLKKK